jgi:hypothetical protein
MLHGRIGGVDHTAEINVTGLAGFLLAKAAAARSRRKPKDWYDIARGGPGYGRGRRRPRRGPLHQPHPADSNPGSALSSSQRCS